MITDTERRRTLESPVPGLAAVSPTQDRIQALLKMGMPPAELREAIGVSEATIRNWMEQTTVPRSRALRALDDLRTAVLALHECGIRGDEAVGWLTSRNLGRWLRGARPIDMLKVDPLVTLAAIQDLLPDNEAESSSESDNVVHLSVQAEATRAKGAGTPAAQTRRKRRRRTPVPV